MYNIKTIYLYLLFICNNVNHVHYFFISVDAVPFNSITNIIRCMLIKMVIVKWYAAICQYIVYILFPALITIPIVECSF